MGTKNAEVQTIYLPNGDGGAKVGLDDYFAARHSLDELFALASSELREPPGGPHSVYSMTGGRNLLGAADAGRRRAGPVSPNFRARIVRDIVRDDGQERTYEHEVEVRLGDEVHQGRVPGHGLQSLGWVTEIAGSRAIVTPGMGLRDHCRAAIQSLSGDIPRHIAYAHSGWREVNGSWLYLHSGGAVGADGAVLGVAVEAGAGPGAPAAA